MRSHRALLIGVLIPAAFSHALYSGLDGGLNHRGPMRRSWYYERSFGPPRFMPPPPPPWVPEAPPPFVQRCDAREVRTLTAPADASDRLDVRTGPGDLRMDGVMGLDHVEVEATLCAASPEALERLEVSVTREGDQLRVVTGGPGPDAGYGRVDLHLSVPLGLQATWGGDALPGLRAHGLARPGFERGPGRPRHRPDF